MTIKGWEFEDWGTVKGPRDQWIEKADKDGDVEFTRENLRDYGTARMWVPLEVLAEHLRRNGYVVTLAHPAPELGEGAERP